MGLDQETQVPVLTKVRGDEDFRRMTALLPVSRQHCSQETTISKSHFVISKCMTSQDSRPGGSTGLCPQLFNAEVWENGLHLGRQGGVIQGAVG